MLTHRSSLSVQSIVLQLLVAPATWWLLNRLGQEVQEAARLFERPTVPTLLIWAVSLASTLILLRLAAFEIAAAMTLALIVFGLSLGTTTGFGPDWMREVEVWVVATTARMSVTALGGCWAALALFRWFPGWPRERER